MLTRRQALLSTLFGTGYVGLRALATGLPAAFLLSPRRALAANPTPTCGAATKAQYFIFNTLGSGDPINANVPGLYDDAKIVHSADAAMAPTPLKVRGQTYTAAAPWATQGSRPVRSARCCWWAAPRGCRPSSSACWPGSARSRGIG